MNINEITRKQHEFFASGKTFDIQYRKEMLVKLRAAVVKYEKRIVAALKEDLGYVRNRTGTRRDFLYDFTCGKTSRTEEKEDSDC